MFAALLALLGWMAWIRRQYAFGKGGMMERVRQTILSSLDFDGRGSLLEVGCGSGALAVRAALTWPEARITGLDYWGAMYNYSQALCERNAASEGVGKQRVFVLRDSMKPQMSGDMNAFAQELRDMGFTGDIEADGGINGDNAPQLARVGIDTLVMGTAFFRAEEPEALVRRVHSL